MAEALRPMSTSELLDRTFTLYRRNFLLFAGIASIGPAAYLLFQLMLVGAAGMPAGRTPARTAWAGASIGIGFVVGPYKGRVVRARCKDVSASIVDGLAKFGIDELTQPYDKDEIAKILARITLGIGKKERDREYICSELVYECFANAGKEFAYNPKGFISPEDVWIDKKVSMIGRIL